MAAAGKVVSQLLLDRIAGAVAAAVVAKVVDTVSTSSNTVDSNDGGNSETKRDPFERVAGVSSSEIKAADDLAASFPLRPYRTVNHGADGSSSSEAVDWSNAPENSAFRIPEVRNAMDGYVERVLRQAEEGRAEQKRQNDASNKAIDDLWELQNTLENDPEAKSAVADYGAANEVIPDTRMLAERMAARGWNSEMIKKLRQKVTQQMGDGQAARDFIKSVIMKKIAPAAIATGAGATRVNKDVEGGIVEVDENGDITEREKERTIDDAIDEEIRDRQLNARGGMWGSVQPVRHPSRAELVDYYGEPTPPPEYPGVPPTRPVSTPGAAGTSTSDPAHSDPSPDAPPSEEPMSNGLSDEPAPRLPDANWSTGSTRRGVRYQWRDSPSGAEPLASGVGSTSAPDETLGAADLFIPRSSPTLPEAPMRPPSRSETTDVLFARPSGNSLSERNGQYAALTRRTSIPVPPTINAISSSQYYYSRERPVVLPAERMPPPPPPQGLKRKAEIEPTHSNRYTEAQIPQTYDSTNIPSMPSAVAPGTSYEWREYSAPYAGYNVPLTSAPNVVGMYDAESSAREMAIKGMAPSFNGREMPTPPQTLPQPTAPQIPMPMGNGKEQPRMDVNAANATNPAFRNRVPPPPAQTPPPPSAMAPVRPPA